MKETRREIIGKAVAGLAGVGIGILINKIPNNAVAGGLCEKNCPIRNAGPDNRGPINKEICFDCKNGKIIVEPEKKADENN